MYLPPYPPSQHKLWSCKAGNQAPDLVNSPLKATGILHTTDHALTPTGIFSEHLQITVFDGVMCLFLQKHLVNKESRLNMLTIEDFSLCQFSSFLISVRVPG